jgi:hypothetical protein
MKAKWSSCAIVGRLVLPLMAFALAATGGPSPTVGVRLILIEGVREFPEATEPGAIRYACAPEITHLSSFFAERDLLFEPDLAHRKKDLGICHVYYEPTLPGFRALPDQAPVRELVVEVNATNFVFWREPVGGGINILKTILDRLPQPLDVKLIATRDFDPEHWADAMKFHFSGSPHRIVLRRSDVTVSHPWTQDYLKAGEVDGQLRVLMPRRLYEGRNEDGEAFGPALDAFREGRYVRSKLSWEGGDLQFAADPKNPDRRIIFFGQSARDYWGKQLSPQEYAYVLRTEFGADQAVDFSRHGPHVDYLISVLPDGIVLVSQPVYNDYAVAKAAAGELLRLYGIRATSGMRALASLLNGPRSGIDEDPAMVLDLIRKIRGRLSGIPPREDRRLAGDLAAHTRQYCPQGFEFCLTPEGQQVMLRIDPGLLRRFLDLGTDMVVEPRLASDLLDLVESQLPRFDGGQGDPLAGKAREIRRLGFEVIRVPYLATLGTERADWPGVSYVNLLAVDRMLFVPTFGLGEVEDRIVDDLRRKLKQRYEVIPVAARLALANNGGVHCLFGIIRETTGN